MTSRRPRLWDELRDVPIVLVLSRLGLTKMRSQSWGPCPACGAARRSAEDDRGPLSMNGPKRWYCFACKAGGDGAELLLQAVGPGPDEWARAHALAVERDLVASDAALDGRTRWTPADLPPASIVRSEAATAPEKSLPDPDEVAALWNACVPVNADREVSGWLRSRAIDPALVAALDLARALPSGGADNVVAVPAWARSWARGWRLIVPCFNAAGELVALRARWTANGPVRGGKERGGTGVSGGGYVYADPMGREILRGVTPARWDGRVIVVEGGPDWMTLATSTSTSTSGPAVVGVWAGAWPPRQAGAAFAERLPARARICLATDANDAGDGYADTIAAHLAGRTWLRVRAPQDNDGRTRDWNDLARAGERPLDLINAAMEPEPETEVEPMADERSAVVDSERVELRPLRDLASVAFDRMEARGRGEESCLPVPWHDLAKVLDSDLAELQPSTNAGWSSLPALRPGVHVLVGGTGSGKTQLALSLALAAARSGHPVGYVGLELDPVGVVARLAALEWARRRQGAEWSDRWSAIDWPRGPDTREALAKIRREVASDLAELPLELAFGDARGGRLGFTAGDFADVAYEMAARGTTQRPALVVLDFLQLLAPDPKQADDREIRTRIARAAYAAANATRDGRCAVLLVSATARDKYGALDGLDLAKLPDVRSLVGTGKESGEIEYAATSVLVLARCSDAPVDRLVGVAKNRHGGTGWAALPWDGSAFYNVPGRLEELLKPTAKRDAKITPKPPPTRPVAE